MIKKKACKGENKKKDTGAEAGVFVYLKKFYHLYSRPAKNCKGAAGVYFSFP